MPRITGTTANPSGTSLKVSSNTPIGAVPITVDSSGNCDWQSTPLLIDAPGAGVAGRTLTFNAAGVSSYAQKNVTVDINSTSLLSASNFTWTGTAPTGTVTTSLRARCTHQHLVIDFLRVVFSTPGVNNTTVTWNESCFDAILTLFPGATFNTAQFPTTNVCAGLASDVFIQTQAQLTSSVGSRPTAGASILIRATTTYSFASILDPTNVASVVLAGLAIPVTY
jgi:hypothetical protein